MIPTVILLGLVLGRWPAAAIVSALIGWPAVLAVSGAMHVEPALVGAAGLAVANVVLGILVHQMCMGAVRRLHHQPSPARSPRPQLVPPTENR